MLYIALLLILVLLLTMVIYVRYGLKTKSKTRIASIRNSWGTPKTEPFYFDLIERYADLNESGFHRISEQTFKDIDFRALFRFIDRTTSKVGQQYLFNKVMSPGNKLDELNNLNSQATFFSNHSALREEIQIELLKLSHNDAYYISSLLHDKLLTRPRWLGLAYASVLSIITLLVLSVKYPVLLVVAIAPVAVNLFVHYWNKKNINQFSKSFPQLNSLIDICISIPKKDSLFKDDSVTQSISSLAAFKRKSLLLGFFTEGSIKDDLAQAMNYVIELIKAMFLIEVLILFHLVKNLTGEKKSVLCLFEYIGGLDTAISVASLRAGSVKTCRPEFITTAKKLSAKNIYHPLIADCVTNTINIQSKSVIITGSNMSGKTTFLRTILLNSILAQTIDTCFADEFKAPILKQFSSIRIDDNVLDGKSYYFEEVCVMRSLVDRVESQSQNIFALDELFRGTNTIERIASAKAILSYLNKNANIVIVSTHDIELPDMLREEYDLYHFTETIENDKLHFDFKLKTGQSKTRNAIKLLELSAYPREVTVEAQAIYNILDMKRDDASKTFNELPTVPGHA
jgi:hypothetical protein